MCKTKKVKVVSGGTYKLPRGEIITVRRLFIGADGRSMAAFDRGGKKMKVDVKLLSAAPDQS